ncbi:hypothetical protein SAMN05660909_01409 [Chitinophaga terrae (ex Kim and Jung 2007)]|uniref:Uncharacterized protein n=1 Tax=Chitinophaga terrae (ex Kim and Jung 2007) TaxID=408074 RepID=A0A1H4A0K6_9BACT|nr:hypothetical protein [Chitinophaga terrae (ex Kim and Jung 2007)]GEP89991.1 hypothetical protein CTE07_16360 [Chitinophaga terrae (ex Kim and Jung 2007)]SEA29683.1 hypothetical protein SAMN05660909_01409 [Chitinophaga terrae (ex Kim and Jung 2007)]
MNKVEVAFLEKGERRAGLVLYSRDVALAFVEACKAERIVLLGIDAFFLTPDTVQPRIEYSRDFSSGFFSGDAYKAAEDLLLLAPDNLFFEMVCE